MATINVNAVARELRLNARGLRSDGSDGIDVRLQVLPNGEWLLHLGDASYDTDHSGVWGADTLPTSRTGRVQRFNSRAMAKSLINQCVDMAVDGGLEDNVVLPYV